MPGLDGLQVIKASGERERATGAHVSAIAVTARARAEDRARYLAVRMGDLPAKPIHNEALWAMTNRLV
jgi:CheY-like chemotaxis protein